MENVEQSPETEHTPQRKLWAAVLAQLILDARQHWLATTKDSTAVHYEQAFDDLVRCGPMTRKCCAWLEATPESVSRSFVRWCERNY